MAYITYQLNHYKRLDELVECLELLEPQLVTKEQVCFKNVPTCAMLAPFQIHTVMETIYDCENAKLNPNYLKQYRVAKKMVAIKPKDATSLYKNAMVNYRMYDEMQYCPFSCISDMEKCIKLTDNLSGKGSTDRYRT